MVDNRAVLAPWERLFHYYTHMNPPGKSHLFSDQGKDSVIIRIFYEIL